MLELICRRCEYERKIFREIPQDWTKNQLLKKIERTYSGKACGNDRQKFGIHWCS